MNPSKLINLLTVSLGLALLQPLSAFAGTITITDLTDTASVALSADLIARGATFSCTGEVCTVHDPAPPGAGSGGGLIGQGINFAHHNLLEPGSSTISDILVSTPVLNAFDLTVTSDSEAGLGISNLPNDITETGLPQEVGYIDWATSGPTTTIVDTIVVQSDIDPTPPTGVPEPISITLFGAGLIGLGALRRRRKAKA